jgi:predicted DNA-binding transcriptional regulator YafY
MPVGRDQLKPMQRLVRIMAVLDQAGQVGATRDRLFEVAEYGDADPGSQLALDIKRLRQQGWNIESIGGAGELGRYRMVSGDNRLRLKLEPRHLAALQRAVILSNRKDLAKSLGIESGSLPPGVGSHVLPERARADLSFSIQAVQLGCRMEFAYKGVERTLDPGTVRFQNNQWYLSGVEAGSDVVKHFVVNDVSDVKLGKPGSAGVVPEVQQIPLHPLLWQVDEPIEVVLRAPVEFEPDVERWMMAPQSRTQVGDHVELTYRVTHRAAFRSRIYILGTRVSLVGPAEFRHEMLSELRQIAGED